VTFPRKLTVKPQERRKDAPRDVLRAPRTEGSRGSPGHASAATALPAAGSREATPRACSPAEQADAALPLAAVTSALFLLSLLEREEQKQGRETVQNLKTEKPAG